MVVETVGMVTGVVTFYNEDRGYGFVVIEGTEDSVFFHINRQRIYYCDGGEQVRWTSAKFDSSVYDLLPTVEDIILFETEQAKPPQVGLRAKFWAQLHNYQTAVQQIANRPVYRMMERTGREAISRLQPRPLQRCVWEGKNISELRTRYPKDHWPCSSEEYFGRHFLRRDENLNQWVLCDDPR